MNTKYLGDGGHDVLQWVQEEKESDVLQWVQEEKEKTTIFVGYGFAKHSLGAQIVKPVPKTRGQVISSRN